MAAQVSPKIPYHSPESVTLRRNSRGRSTRSSFTSTAPASPRISANRPYNATALTFSHKPSDLKKWLLADDLWSCLPCEVQAALTAMQHAGAAVSTACKRLHGHELAREDDTEEVEVQSQAVIPGQKTDLRIRTFSSDSNALGDSVSNLGDSMYSPVFSSQSSGSTAPSPALTCSQMGSPTSPVGSFCLPPNEEVFTQTAQRPRDRSVSTSKEPYNTFYAMELSYLRTEAMPRLCHLRSHVDIEWNEAKRRGTVSGEPIAQFEEFWVQKKDHIDALDGHVKFLAKAEAIPSSGLGWNYVESK